MSSLNARGASAAGAAPPAGAAQPPSHARPHDAPQDAPAASAGKHGACSPRPLRRPLLVEFMLVLGLFTLSASLLAWIFPSGGLWPLTFVCLVPWGYATCVVQRAWLAHWLSFFVGWGFFLWSLRWLEPVTGLGFVALGFYLAVYWVLAGWAVRTGRRRGVSPVWTLPVVWVACEYLRAWVMTGFPWLFLAHALHAQLPLIQISDLTGAYGVSFLAGLVNGLILEGLLSRRRLRRGEVFSGQWRVGAALTGFLYVLSLTYGYWQIHVNSPRTIKPAGPRVAVVQEDFPQRSTPPYSSPGMVILSYYLAQAAQAAAAQPDLLIFPETAWGATQNLDFLAVERRAVDGLPTSTWIYGIQCHKALAAFARGDYAEVNRVIALFETWLTDQKYDLPRLPERGPPTTVLVGSQSVEVFPDATYPKFLRYNSALIYDADGAQRAAVGPDGRPRSLRYDKIHLVPFGEVVPFRQTRLHWLYVQLNKLSPFSFGGTKEYTMTAGRTFTVFDLRTERGAWTFGVPICYEDVMPYICRNFVWQDGRRRVDFLVNISNDGWFLHSHELPQHLAICAFRAVENRVSIARSVNTGISGFIDPNGRIISLVRKDGRYWGVGISGYDVATLPLDSRPSLYGRLGDWFAQGCLVVATVLWMEAIIVRWIRAIQQRLWLRRRQGAA